MEILLHQIVSGLISGATYGLLALALVMIYQSTHHLNFAQGEMATLSTFIAWALIKHGLPYWAAFAAAVCISFTVGAAIQLLLMSRFAKAPELTNVIVFVALLIGFNAVSGWLFGHEINTFPSPFDKETWYSSQYLSAHAFGSLCLMGVLIGALYVFLNKTRLGMSMQAAALNPASARLVGISVAAMFALGWGIASSIGAVAGMMVAPFVFLDPGMMSGVLLYAFAGALIGGVDSPWGAAVGGLIVGVAENLIGAYLIGTELKLSVALLLIVGVLLVKPSGMFGKVVVQRV